MNSPSRSCGSRFDGCVEICDVTSFSEPDPAPFLASEQNQTKQNRNAETLEELIQAFLKAFPVSPETRCHAPDFLSLLTRIEAFGGWPCSSRWPQSEPVGKMQNNRSHQPRLCLCTKAVFNQSFSSSKSNTNLEDYITLDSSAYFSAPSIDTPA